LYSGSTKILTADSTTGVATFTSNIITTAPTPTPNSNNTQLATTAYVDGKMVLGTSVASTSGTSIDFTGIPSWVKRITIMFNGVSTNGSSGKLVQIGSGSLITSGYSGGNGWAGQYTDGENLTAGFGFAGTSADDVIYGHMIITLISGNTYIASHYIGFSNNRCFGGGGSSVNASAIIDRIRITTVNGSDTFDAGSINIMYEG
jgi:hypothetical protein